ncbi:5948_t:CDS:2 [Funneliformis geosporum]|nr:5948_t:CDS:2 [Funneliformis geosporum]
MLDLVVASDELLIDLRPNQTRRLSQNFSQLLDDADDYDVIIRVGENQEIKEFCAHSIILKSRSPYFKIAFSQNWISKKDNKIIFNKPNIPPRIFDMIIRFFDIASKDFHSNVRAFRKLLPQTLFEDIVSFHMSNTEPKLNKLDPRSKKVPIDSMIIKPKHAATLINWIQRKDANARIPINNKYKFNLIYRGSMDGFGTNDIRSKCDGHEACILVIKVKENDTIIGGYNPIGWNYNSNTFFVKGRKTSRKGHRLDRAFSINSIIEDYWVNTTESFIYSLGDGNDLNNFKISRVINNNYAIYESYHQHIPINFGYSDLVINGNVAGTCKKAYYESCILDTCHFTIEEMEVFVFQDGDDE